MAIERLEQGFRLKKRESKQVLNPELLALDALTFLAADEERLGDFLAATGLARDTLRSAAADPGFLPGVLAYLAADEGLLVAFATSRELDPDQVGQVIARAGRNEGPSP